MRAARAVLTSTLLLAVGAPAVSAQPPGYGGIYWRAEQIDASHWRFTGPAEIELDEAKGQKFYANLILLDTETHTLEATGTVVYETPTARIAAERAVFKTRAGTGTFYNATGSASIGERADKSMFGALEPDVMFYGEIVEKTGEDRYKITNGAFTTCVQPTPRWELAAGSATIRVGDYALLRNAVMRVKDVPVFYLPLMYYPIQDDDRATGFLLPTYGVSRYQGQSISNAFFWAISRSQDLTVLHDWFMQTGQGYGSEYRWVRSGASSGNLRAYRLLQKAATVNGFPVPESRSFLMNGNIAQDLPFRLKGRARIDYSSNVSLNQLYSRDIYNATQSQSTVTGNVSGSWQFVNASLTASRNQQFITPTYSILSGTLPSLTASISNRKLGPLPIFFAVQGEASRPFYTQKDSDREIAQDLVKVDLAPTLRAPVGNLPFLNMNVNAGFRTTWYSQRYNNARDRVPVDTPLLRQYGEFRADVVGPVFSRVFTPNNAFADRLKHVIEPAFSVQRTTSIDNGDLVVLLGNSYDRVIGDVTRVTYGLTNRVLVRRPAKEGAAPTASAPRELLTAAISQSYYSQQEASRYDSSYSSTFIDVAAARPPSNYSPVAMTLRSQPMVGVGAQVRAEYDYGQRKMLSVSTGGDYGSPTKQVAASWSRSLSSFYPTNTLNGSTRMTFREGRMGGNYQINWDIERGYVLQQRTTAFYNAQCCGFMIEYQEYNFGAISQSPVRKDRRFNFAFTLAGIGTFSNFFGNFGGASY